MYVDESGDVGQNNSPTRYFVLSAIFIHESKWKGIVDDLNSFRREVKNRYGLLKKDEIHASQFITGRSNLNNKINRDNRARILIECLNWLRRRDDLSIITVRNDKQRPSSDIFLFSWCALIQRFENTLKYSNFPMPHPLTNVNEFSRDQRGLVLSDNTDGGKLRKLLRKMRYINNIPNMHEVFPTGSRNLPLEVIIEDTIMRDSSTSYMHQMVDVVAYFARQVYEPNGYFRRRGIVREYGRLANVINKRATHYNTNFGIVEL
jgi:hypothetical protein